MNLKNSGGDKCLLKQSDTPCFDAVQTGLLWITFQSLQVK